MRTGIGWCQYGEVLFTLPVAAVADPSRSASKAGLSQIMDYVESYSTDYGI